MVDFNLETTIIPSSPKKYTVNIVGPNSNEATIGREDSISVPFPAGVASWLSQSWGLYTYDDSTFGTTTNPTSLSVGNTEVLLWQGVGDDSLTYRASTEILYAAPIADSSVPTQNWYIDIDPGILAMSNYFTGTVENYSITTGALPTGRTLNTSTGDITGTPTADDGTSPVVIAATNSGGSDTQSVAFTVSTPELTNFSITENTDSTPDTVSLTSNSAGTIYAGVYPSGTTVGDVTPSLLVTGDDSVPGQIDSAYNLGTLTAGGDDLTDVDINPTGLIGGTDYFLAVVQDIDDGGTYTNVVGGEFTENITGGTINSITGVPGGGLLVDYTGTLNVTTAAGGGILIEVT